MNEPALIDEKLIMRVISRLPHEPTLKVILKDEGISAKRFFDYLLEHPRYDASFALAQSARAELLADEIIDIADTESDPQRARNRIDARKWVASKLKPNKFGDRIDVNVSHTVDIGEALRDARARTGALPKRDLEIPTIAETIEITQYNKTTPTDDESGESSNPLKSYDDLFS